MDKLIIVILLILTIIGLIWMSNMHEERYNNCMEKHNNQSFCEKIYE